MRTSQNQLSKTFENSVVYSLASPVLFAIGMPTNEDPPNYEYGQDIRDRTFAFACHVVKFCQTLYEGGGVGQLMAPQLVHSSTSAASMLEEARAAESDADFVSKCCISLKECRETWTRLRVCQACKVGDLKEAAAMIKEGGELIAIIGSIIRNKRRSMAAKPGRSRRRLVNS